jgi:hypothetical protein
MLIYSIGIEEKFGQKPVQIVLFVGKGNPPPSTFMDEFTIHKFIVLDMKKIDPDEFLRSEKPEEVIIGILAGKFNEKPKIIEKVKERIVEIVKNEERMIKYQSIVKNLGKHINIFYFFKNKIMEVIYSYALFI